MSLSIQAAMGAASRKGLNCAMPPRVGDSLISRARQNELVPFMQRNFDYLFSLDDDVDIPENTLVKLIENDKDICAGLYRFKSSEPGISGRIPSDGPKWAEILQRNLVVPAIYASTGCMMVKREVIEGMIEKYPELEYRRNLVSDVCWALYMPFVKDGEYLSEDWAFCRRAKDAGFEVWIDGGIKCGHWMQKRISFEEI